MEGLYFALNQSEGLRLSPKGARTVTCDIYIGYVERLGVGDVGAGMRTVHTRDVHLLEMSAHGGLGDTMTIGRPAAQMCMHAAV